MQESSAAVSGGRLDADAVLALLARVYRGDSDPIPTLLAEWRALLDAVADLDASNARLVADWDRLAESATADHEDLQARLAEEHRLREDAEACWRDGELDERTIDGLADTARRLAAERDRMRHLAAEMLSHFTHRSADPGRPYLRTAWVPESTVDRWRDGIYPTTTGTSP